LNGLTEHMFPQFIETLIFDLVCL